MTFFVIEARVSERPYNVNPANQDDVADPTVLEYLTPAEKRPGRPPVGGRGPATYGSVLWLAWPTIVEQLVFGIIGAVDTVVAGHTSGDSAVNAAASAAVGTMTYMQWFVGLMTSALGVGATAIVARSMGAKRIRVANRVAGTAFSSAFLLGVAMALLLWIFAGTVVHVCGLRDLAATFGEQYLRIMVVTVCLQTAGQLGMASLRGAGDTLRPMLITLTIMLVNLITVPTLAYGWFGFPRWGIQGNAMGTMIAYAIAGIATTLLLISGWGRLKLRRHHFRIVPHILVRVLRIGLPSWAEGMLLWLGQFAIVVLIINRNDAALAALWGDPGGASGVTMAAHNAVLRVESFAFLPGFGFGISASALVGQYLGARMPQEARRAATLANRLAFLTMTLAALPMVLVPSLLLSLVVKSERVVEVGRVPMIIAGLAQPGFAIAIIMSSGLKGAGETIWPMISTVTGMLLRLAIVVPVAWFLLPHWGLAHRGLIAVWVGIFVDLNYRAMFCGTIFRMGQWMRTKV